MATDLFDIKIVIDQFNNAAKDSEDDVIVDHYIKAFTEILK